MSDAIRLSATDYAALAQALRDTNEIGRMRTSTEIHGHQHRKRGHMLASLVRLEELGFVARQRRPGRKRHSWKTGVITPHGRAYLATYTPPAKRGSAHVQQGLGPDGGTRFANMLVALDAGPILSLGAQNPKLGSIVTKGRHKGRQVRAVTLEEGRTCPAACQIRDRCYGGGMPGAKRLRWEGEGTGKAIAEAIRHAGKPVLVRLHTLGDFVSIAYAREIVAALTASGAAAFGYTHWAPETAIGYALRRWAREHWDIFSIRTSYLAGSRTPIAERAAVIVEHPEQAKEHDAVVCPEQMGKVASCAQCGFCWHSRRNVAFVLHETLVRLRKEDQGRETDAPVSAGGRPSAPVTEAA